MTFIVPMLLYMVVTRLVATTNIRLISACLLVVIPAALFQEVLIYVHVAGYHLPWINLWNAPLAVATLLQVTVCGMTFTGIRQDEDSLSAYFGWAISGALLILMIPTIVSLLGIH